MEQYLPALVTGLIAFGGWAVTFGTLREATKQNSERLTKLESTESRQWESINELNRELGVLQGHLQANGLMQPKGKAAHA
jgi:hypothetical protein